MGKDKKIPNVNVEDLLNDIKSIVIEKKFKQQDTKDSIELYFIEKSNEGKYLAYSPSISENIQKSIQKIVKEKIVKVQKDIYDKGYIQDTYNVSGQIDGVIEVCSREFIEDIDNLILSLDDENQLKNMIKTESIHTYCFKLKHNSKVILAFRRFTKMKKLREGFLGMLEGGSFKKIDGDLLGVDSDIDLILYEDNILILNHVSLERIFNLCEQFKSEAGLLLEDIRSKNIILNFEEFEKDVLNNVPAIRRLNKIKSNGTLLKFCSDFSKVVKVSTDLDLGITFNKDKTKIVYKDKNQITQLTLLMNDAYYKTLIGDEEGIDKLK